MWRAVNVVALIAVAVTFGFFGWWWQDREPPVRTLAAKVGDSNFRPGGELYIHYRVDRLRSCEMKIDRILFDAAGVRYVLDDLNFAGAPGPLGLSGYTSVISIPRTFAQGFGRYRVTTAAVCNPLHRIWPIVYTASEIEFQVSGPPIAD